MTRCGAGVTNQKETMPLEEVFDDIKSRFEKRARSIGSIDVGPGHRKVSKLLTITIADLLLQSYNS